MDIKDLYTSDLHEDGAEMRVKNQYGDDTDMYISLAGVDSKLWRHEKIRGEREALNRYKKLESGSIDLEKSVDEAAKLTAELLANITLGWRGFTSEGQELEFSREKAAELYLCAPYIREQVDNFFSNRVNFTKGKAIN